jgi:beta-lactamase class A
MAERGRRGRPAAAGAPPSDSRRFFFLALATFIVSVAVLGVVVSGSLTRHGRSLRSILVEGFTADVQATPAPAVEPPASQPSSIAPVRGESAPRQPDDPALRSAVEAALGADIEHYGVVVKRLRDGRGVAINPDQQFYAASLFKLAVLYEAERRQSAGELDFSSPLQLTEADVAEDLGTIGDLQVDDEGKLPIWAAVEAMVTHSDNASAVALLHLLTGAKIDSGLQELGIEHTSVNTEELPTTAGDMALLMEAIITGRGLNESSLIQSREFLLAQLTRSGIPSAVPSDVSVGNKTGTWGGATHDVAFVDAPTGTYVIAVLSDHDWDWGPIARVSRAVYDILAGG